MSQYRGQFALMNGHIQIFKHADRLLSFFHMVAEADPLCFDKIIHSCFLPPFFEFEDAILSQKGFALHPFQLVLCSKAGFHSAKFVQIFH